ncbi:MAG TPA: arginine--tRNA ligase [Burkholderiales bacterium]|nr:arginine--tRNA ligase [Burkholderiales bacterium]
MKSHLTQLFAAALGKVAPSQLASLIELQRPKLESHGDYSCNLALLLAKPLRRNPRDIAAELLAALPASPHVEKAEIAGAGFINLFLRPSAKQQVVADILTSAENFGRSRFGAGKKIQIEFVSANPTGPLHVGHGRGAAFGASLANVLEAAGYEVWREFYVNDAGRQMDILVLSTWLRYLELTGIHIPFPQNAYQGDYVRAMAEKIYAAHGKRYVQEQKTISQGVIDAHLDPEAHLDGLIANAKKLLGKDYADIHRFVLTEQLNDCRNDLAEFGVTFDAWFSEKSLFDSGQASRAIALLEKKGHIYTKDGAKWFDSSKFGDEKDRVVQRDNGEFTYFAGDIAYHLDKFERAFDRVIDIWGADHHGYIARLKGVLRALGFDPDRLTVELVQFAVLYRNGKKVPMSTRAGEFVTLRELRQEVGNDAARFFYVLRKSDQHLDFDLDLAKTQSTENPVYYVQYAHARICSVLNEWGEDEGKLKQADLAPLTSAHELSLLQRLIEYPEIVEAAARELSPHLIAFYLKELAAEFHSYYNATRFLVPEAQIRNARLALVTAVRQVLRNGLRLVGVSCPEKM